MSGDGLRVDWLREAVHGGRSVWSGECEKRGESWARSAGLMGMARMPKLFVYAQLGPLVNTTRLHGVVGHHVSLTVNGSDKVLSSNLGAVIAFAVPHLFIHIQSLDSVLERRSQLGASSASRTLYAQLEVSHGGQGEQKTLCANKKQQQKILAQP
ncbi:hypothetical protein AAT19DRAFT_16221 [Rhodotorula toruloides]|uniref:Uncharacterized protein n=1 Tax=Rhodotorula toruloides TaxID=5286 RepID=A0A2T0A618_RHOTO|nr:hypothetical protein AAT19DRAFT_16221 [Rhodotorula toruloides]